MLNTKRLLWTVSTIFYSSRGRAVTSTTCRFPVHHHHHHHQEQFHAPTTISASSFLQNSGSYCMSSKRTKFLRKPPNFSGKTFCSESSGKVTPRCWNCNAEHPFLVCFSCRAVQPVDHTADYFQIFGLEKKYEIGDENLQGKYKDWQKKLHPDLVHSKSEKERQFSAEQSARVIDAYRTLTNPLSRAIYILKLEGVDVNEEETVSEPELLTEIMEIREAVEEAPDSQALNVIQSQMQEKLQHWSNSFVDAFRSQKFEEAITCIRRMTYYNRVNEEIVKRL